LRAPRAAPVVLGNELSQTRGGKGGYVIGANRSFQVACLLAPFCMGLSLAGCATSEKVQAKQIADREMSCEQLVTENRKLDDAAGKVDANRGVTGTNIASALF
jgi:hypothetical protein